MMRAPQKQAQDVRQKMHSTEKKKGKKLEGGDHWQQLAETIHIRHFLRILNLINVSNLIINQSLVSSIVSRRYIFNT
jgi:hypothetical protein